METIRFDDKRLANKIVVEQHKRWIFPFACLVLGFMALPLATAFQGLHRQSGMITALFFFLLYYGILSLGIGMGESGLVSPWLGLWLPNLIVLLLSLYALRLTNLERFPHVSEALHNLQRRWKKDRSEAEKNKMLAGGGE